MSGILPETASGGVITRSAGGIPANPSNVSNVYVPPADFGASCALTALPDDCTARITAAQINALVSELMCFAATLNPTGTWTCSSLCNLATNFEGWLTTFGPVMSFNGRGGAVTLVIGDLLAIDGAGSGLDADLLDGVNGASYALLASPTFTGVPAGPTAAPGTNTTQLATTAFVTAALVAEGVNSFNTRTGAVVLTIGDLTALDGAGSGLDADLLDGQDGSYYLAAASYTAADVLAKLLTVDGAGSGIDADLLDGQSSAYYLAASSYTAADVLAKLLTVDGAGSGLDADLLDGISSAAFALLASPTFTGTPAAPTAAPGTATTQIATTAFVDAAIVAATAGVASFNTRTGAVTLTSGDVTGALTYTPVNKAGDTMTGNLRVDSAWAGFTSDADPNTSAYFIGKKNGINRWIAEFGGSDAETGSNAGSNFYINRYSDAGSYLSTPLIIARNTGMATWEKIESGSFGRVSVKSYGALGDGSTDDSAAIASARANAIATGRALYFPASTGAYVTTWLSLWDDGVIVGDGPRRSVIKLKAGEATNVIYGANNRVQIRDLGIDGNKANCPSGGSGIELNGIKNLIRNVFVINANGHGLYLDGPDSGADYGMESTFETIVVDKSNFHGIRFDGPHDSHFANVIVIDASQAANDGYSGFYIGAATNGRFVNCHSWSRSGTTNRCHYAADINGYGTEWWGCHLEGAYSANVHINGATTLMDNCRFYAAWNGVNVILRQPHCRINGLLLDPGAGRPACKGIVMGTGSGDNVSACFIDIMAAEQQAGVFDFTYDDGNNTIFCRGYNGAGTNVVGSPASGTVCLIDIKGGTTTVIHNGI